MARVTVEDCIEKVPNRFGLVLLAGHRARSIANGAALTLDEFALWLHLDDVYWQEEGRQSVTALIVAVTITAALVIGAFWEGGVPLVVARYSSCGSTSDRLRPIKFPLRNNGSPTNERVRLPTFRAPRSPEGADLTDFLSSPGQSFGL